MCRQFFISFCTGACADQAAQMPRLCWHNKTFTHNRFTKALILCALCVPNCLIDGIQIRGSSVSTSLSVPLMECFFGESLQQQQQKGRSFIYCLRKTIEKNEWLTLLASTLTRFLFVYFVQWMVPVAWWYIPPATAYKSSPGQKYRRFLFVCLFMLRS